MGGMWQHADVVRGTFTFDDLLDAHEMMAVNAENERRSLKAAERNLPRRR